MEIFSRCQVPQMLPFVLLLACFVSATTEYGLLSDTRHSIGVLAYSDQQKMQVATSIEKMISVLQIN